MSALIYFAGYFTNDACILPVFYSKKIITFPLSSINIFAMMPTDMNTPKETNEKIHHGRNVKRFREMLGLKQEGLAYELGDDWNQKRISSLEQKETIDDDLLGQISRALKVPVAAIKNFDEKTAINIIADTVNNHDQSASVFYNAVINPIEKWIEALEENKKLYERLLQVEKEKVELLQFMLAKK
jgi:transcriptional regulator with XRE-family HTH domain